MSGHSKWSTIKHKKAANDARRGSEFTKLAKAITVAVKKGGGVGDSEFNFALRLAVEKARSANMPKDNIERAIERGMGKGEGAELDEVVLEGYGPYKVAVVVETVTDNRNRTVAEIKAVFDRAGGRLSEPGSVLYLFKRLGVVSYVSQMGEETELAVIELGATELGQGVVWCELGKEALIGEYLQKQGLEQVEVGVEYKPQSKVELAKDERVMVEALLVSLAEHDDVQEVYANWE